jgi:hypothetical protein
VTVPFGEYRSDFVGYDGHSHVDHVVDDVDASFPHAEAELVVDEGRLAIVNLLLDLVQTGERVLDLTQSYSRTLR